MWYTATSASVTNGSDVVRITNGDDISIVQENSGLVFEGSSPVEVLKAYLDIGGNKVIQLARPWPYSTKTNQPLVAYPTDADFAAATAELRRVIGTLTIASTAEAQLGEDDEKIMTPLKTKASIDFQLDQRLEDIEAANPYPWAMRKVEFEAHRAANNEKFAASGFVHFGQHYPEKEHDNGLQFYESDLMANTLALGRNDKLGTGSSKTTEAVINISGVVTQLNHKGSGRAVDIKLPPAEDGKRTYDSATGVSVTHATPAIAFASETETNKVVTDRVDMWGFESFLREINDADPFVYENGLIQSLATNINGVSTVTDNVRPDTYFAWYEGDDSSTGKGVNWKTATEAQRTTIASNPDNNIYFDDATGKFYQWCIRGRSFAGVGNGEWDNIDAISGDLQFDSFNKITPTMSGSTKFSAEGDIGVFTAENNSHCHLLVCGTVNRLNQGVYHPSFNPAGSVADINGNKWHNTALSFTSTASYFDPSKLSTTVSGRPDGRLANYIYASGAGGVCRDMRYSAWGLTQEDFAEQDLAVKSGEYRGRELLKFTKVFESVVAVGSGYTIVNQDNPAAVVAVKTLTTSIAGEYTHTEVIGDPANIQLCDDLKDGWVGTWNTTTLDGRTIDVPLTRTLSVNDMFSYALTRNYGASWSVNSSSSNLNYITSSRTTSLAATEVIIFQYQTRSRMTKNTVKSEVYGGNIGNVLTSSRYDYARDLGFSLTGKINTSNTSADVGNLTLINNVYDSDGQLSTDYLTEHNTLNLGAPTNDSPAFKALNYNVVENQQGFINYAYTELKHNGTDWGDDSEIHIANNQATRTDDNGNEVVYGTARIVEPLGWIKNDK